MNRELLMTEDGSFTVSIPEIHTTYHSTRGAIQESEHVFIKTGLKFFTEKNNNKKTVDIFEMGFGTGLNALLSFMEAERLQLKINYTSIEFFPLEPSITSSLNYHTELQDPGLLFFFGKIHSAEWNTQTPISPRFNLHKQNADLKSFSTEKVFDLIYFDAFDPKTQPELWTKEIFEKMFSMLREGGILVTYSSKSEVRKAMVAAGFAVEKPPGPWGKREIVRAFKA